MKIKEKRIKEIEKESEGPDFWKDAERSGKISQELAGLKTEVSSFESLKKEFADLKELTGVLREGELDKHLKELSQKIKKEEFKTFLSGKYDRGNAILTITAGAGGQDAQDWATILFRMYERYVQYKGWKGQIIHQSFGEPGPEGRIGTKQVVFEIRGTYAYGFLKKEDGIHRLVRISPFSSKSLRHTSFASIEVIPEIDATVEKIDIAPDELKVDTYRASGPGGQNVNKRETAIRITHIPTGIVVSSQTQRNQAQNKENAMSILSARILEQQQEKLSKGEAATRKSQIGSAQRSEKIRTYNFPQDRITDHRIKKSWHGIEQIMQGNMEEIVKALLEEN